MTIGSGRRDNDCSSGEITFCRNHRAATLLGNQTLLSQTIEQAYINVLNAQGQYDAAVEELTANQEAFRVAAEELKVGASNLVAYLQQKTLYTQAFENYVQAKYNSALSIEIYDFYMGIAVKL